MIQIEPESKTVTALFRLAAARLGIPSIGIYLYDNNSAYFWTGTADFPIPADSLKRIQVQTAKRSSSVSRAVLSTSASRVDPSELGLRCEYAAMIPIRHDGSTRAFMLFTDQRGRWLGPHAADGMRDVAELFAALMFRGSGAPVHSLRSVPDTQPEQIRSREICNILPHRDAHRMIRSACSDPGGPTAVMLLDVDRFRAINAALGAAAGDAILTTVAERIETRIGKADKLARLESDRYLLISNRPEEEIPELADTLLDCVCEPMAIAGNTLTVQATIGLVVPQSDEHSASSLFMQADTALRRGKAGGGNRIVMHEPLIDEASQERSRVELDLANALENGELHLVYQPYTDLELGEVTGAEALLRWTHPVRGEMNPVEFIGLAEDSGHILPIGGWALQTALNDAMSWSENLNLSVNISALQFHQTEIITQIDAALAYSGFPAERLELEITESVLLRQDPETIGRIRTLIARGIRIALDDFGTGYSALSYLARIPHHRIKMDRSFVQDIDNPITADLIRAIIQSARAQGVSITAEGVETEKQLRKVRDAGFTHAQGFALNEPIADISLLRGGRENRAIA